MVLFEACVEGVDGVLAAQRGGAHRIELCASLTEGGISPSPGVVARVMEVAQIPIMCMVRPRGGDFCYTDEEHAGMLGDIAAYRSLGAHGVVFGVLSPDGTIDKARTADLIAAAGPMEVTIHRAFDMTSSAEDALETLIALGATRVLTSGQAATAPAGEALIAQLVRQAAGRIQVLPGCGLLPPHIEKFVAATGVDQVHATAFAEDVSPMQFRNERVYMGIPGLPEYARQITSEAEVRRFVEACRAAS